MKLSFASRKFDKKKWVSFVLIILTIGSSLAYSILQAFGGRSSSGQNSTAPDMPSSNIINYKLTPEQEDYALRLGKTLLEYRYTLGCTNCSTQKGYLESFTNQLSDQLLLQEIVDSSQTSSVLYVTSYYGTRTVKDPSGQAIFGALCEIMVQPPIQCATKNV